MEFLDPKLDEYVVAHSEAEDDLLQELNRETTFKGINPSNDCRSLSGEGTEYAFSYDQSKICIGNRYLYGVFSLCFAEGIAEGGVIITIDHNEELKDMQDRYFSRSKYASSIKSYVGNALDVIPTIIGEFDMVYIDADKENYCNYFDEVIDRVPKGGYIIADNVLWSAKVIEEAEEKDEETRKLQE